MLEKLKQFCDSFLEFGVPGFDLVIYKDGECLLRHINGYSDIGNNYCSVTGDVKIEYLYMDIYNEESQWSSNVFYTKGNDTILLKKYVGQEITVSGEFDAECHGIPYITNIEIVKS